MSEQPSLEHFDGWLFLISFMDKLAFDIDGTAAL